MGTTHLGRSQRCCKLEALTYLKKGTAFNLSSCALCLYSPHASVELMLNLMAATERQFSDYKSLKTEMKAALHQRRDKQKEAKMYKKAYIYYMQGGIRITKRHLGSNFFFFSGERLTYLLRNQARVHIW